MADVERSFPSSVHKPILPLDGDIKHGTPQSSFNPVFLADPSVRDFTYIADVGVSLGDPRTHTNMTGRRNDGDDAAGGDPDILRRVYAERDRLMAMRLSREEFDKGMDDFIMGLYNEYVENKRLSPVVLDTLLGVDTHETDAHKRPYDKEDVLRRNDIKASQRVKDRNTYEADMVTVYDRDGNPYKISKEKAVQRERYFGKGR